MKTRMKRTIVAILVTKPVTIFAAMGTTCLFLAGCAVADFSPYSGTQQNWPVSSGTFVDNKYAVPVFFGAPNRPYIVLGYLNAETRVTIRQQ
jgi:hypothetical protein